MLMPTRPDPLAVSIEQRDMHARLENWGRWARPGYPGGCSPMFRLYRAPDLCRDGGDGPKVDALDAQHVQKEVGKLPMPHRTALNRYYVHGDGPKRMRQALNCSPDAVALYLRDARGMLIARKT